MRLKAPQRASAYQAEAFAKASKTPARAQMEIPTNTTLVVVADSNETTRALAVEALESWGFQVLVAEDAKTCLDLLDLGMLPHLLLMAFPGAEGEECAERLARAVPDLEVILALSADELAQHAQRAGWRAGALVRSPYVNLEELRLVVAAAFERAQQKLFSRFLSRELDVLHRRLEIETRIAMEISEAPDADTAMLKGLEGLAEIFEGPAVFFRWFPEQNSLQAELRYPTALFAGAHPRLMAPGYGRAALERLESDEGFRAMLEQAARMDSNSETLNRSWKLSIVEARGRPRGIIAVAPATWNEATDRPSLSRAVRTLSVGWDAADARSQATDAAIRDHETKLLTYRHFNERLAEEIQRAWRLWHPVSLLTIEVISDNDDGSADESPEALQQRVVRHLSKVLKTSFRATDLITSLGGQRFAVALPHTSLADALLKGERLRSEVAEESESALRLHVGAAEYPGHAAELAGLVQASNEACETATDAAVNLATPPEGFVPPFVPTSVRVQTPIVKNPT